MTITAQHVLDFWFKEINPTLWWSAEPEFDDTITKRFGELLKHASQGEYFYWRTDAFGRLAEIIVLDQFSRNIHRGSARAFAQDAMALVLAQEAVATNLYLDLSPTECSFILLPYMHSESALIHRQAEKLYREHAPQNNYDFELRHKAIIDRFGRYPHRNEILGRESTLEEIEFLKQPGSSF